MNYKSNKNEEENIFFFSFNTITAFLVNSFLSCFVWRWVLKKRRKKKKKKEIEILFNENRLTENQWILVDFTSKFLSTIPRVMLSDAIDTIKKFFALQDYKDGENNWKFEIARFSIFLPVLLILTLTLTLILSQRIYICSDIFFFLRSAYAYIKSNS